MWWTTYQLVQDFRHQQYHTPEKPQKHQRTGSTMTRPPPSVAASYAWTPRPTPRCRWTPGRRWSRTLRCACCAKVGIAASSLRPTMRAWNLWRFFGVGWCWELVGLVEWVSWGEKDWNLDLGGNDAGGINWYTWWHYELRFRLDRKGIGIRFDQKLKIPIGWRFQMCFCFPCVCLVFFFGVAVAKQFHWERPDKKVPLKFGCHCFGEFTKVRPKVIWDFCFTQNWYKRSILGGGNSNIFDFEPYFGED